jgi:hypothetical protein
VRYQYFSDSIRLAVSHLMLLTILIRYTTGVRVRSARSSTRYNLRVRTCAKVRDRLPDAIQRRNQLYELITVATVDTCEHYRSNVTH